MNLFNRRQILRGIAASSAVAAAAAPAVIAAASPAPMPANLAFIDGSYVDTDILSLKPGKIALVIMRDGTIARAKIAHEWWVDEPQVPTRLVHIAAPDPDPDPRIAEQFAVVTAIGVVLDPPVS